MGSPSPRSLIRLRWACDPMRGLPRKFCWKRGKSTIFPLGLLSWADEREHLRPLHGPWIQLYLTVVPKLQYLPNFLSADSDQPALIPFEF